MRTESRRGGRPPNPPVARVCEWCGITFSWRPSPSAVRRGFGRFHSRGCASAFQLHHRDQRGPRNHTWKGDAAAVKSGHERARALYPHLGTCEACGLVPAVERHHRDGNTLNNSQSNVALLCDRCHTRLHLLRTHCKRGHPFDDANTYIRPTGDRRCRACSAAYQRRLRRARRQPVMGQSSHVLPEP